MADQNALHVEVVETSSDKLIVYVIAAVALLALVALCGIIALALRGQVIPDVLQNIAVGSLTGLTALLVARRS